MTNFSKNTFMRASQLLADESYRGFRKLLLVGLFVLPCLSSGQVEKTRSWTNVEGVKVLAKILRVEENEKFEKTIILEVAGKETRVPLNLLSQDDQNYVWGFEQRQPVGELSKFEITPPSEERDFLSAHHMESWMWKGEVYGNEFSMPFQLHVPPAEKIKKNEKLPIIVHLHGTGGLGTGNLKPLFSDAGGIAKSYLSEEFQRYQACYVMIPQGNVEGCWFGIGVTSPARTMKAVVNALRLLTQDERFSVDPTRIYLIGLSLGGAGVFEGVAKFPGFFAAGIPISYVGYPSRFKKEWNNASPLWVVINKHDLYYPNLRGFRQHYLKIGGKIRTTVFDQKGHNAWSKLFKDEGIRQWLFRQKLD